MNKSNNNEDCVSIGIGINISPQNEEDETLARFNKGFNTGSLAVCDTLN